ncbi:MAG: sensor histidine kinase [Candidatus Thorarchaeota archaeon]|jgi:signal transduction histidine kinase
MQSLEIILDIVLILAFLAFYATVAWGLIKYSTKHGYRLWAIGWIVYTIGALQGAFASGSGLVLQDGIALVCMYVGATLILDGTRSNELTKRRIRIYGLGILLFSILLVIGIAYNIGFQLIFTPLGFHVVMVTFLAARTAYGFENIGNSSKWWLITGLLLVGGSWIFFPLTYFFFELFPVFILFEAAGVLITGAAMLTMFTSTVTKDLETQYQISQIISGLVQHDIRNYIQTARHALELTEGNDVVENRWINIASEVLVDAGHFIDEMRDISLSLSQLPTPSERGPLVEIVDKARDRVIKEYKLNPEQVKLQVPADAVIGNSRLIDELLWNILDNAFKHGSPSVSIRGKVFDASYVELEISDRGSGLPENLKEFLNSPDALSKPDMPMVGLGVLLIRGIASLCGIQLLVSDNVDDISVTGTTYNLRFNGSK